MKLAARNLVCVVLLLCSGLSGCATSLENLVSSPKVALSDVEIMGLGFKSQTFLLSFDVSNPNSFSLPVSGVSYGIKLDGQRFASGQTPSKFSVPANGETQFAISVELDLMQTAPRILSIVRQGDREKIDYELQGELAIDIPFTPPVSYHSTGTIRVGSGAF